MKKQNYEILKRLASSEFLRIDWVEGDLCCLRDLDSWEQVERIAAQKPTLQLRPTVLHQRAGESYWHIVGDAYAPLEITAADYGESYDVYTKNDAELFEQNCLDFLSDFDSISAAAEYAAKAAVTLEKIKELQPGQIVVAYCDEYIETTDQRTMYFWNDSNIWIVALVAYDD